jgi:hypothetical protein
MPLRRSSGVECDECAFPDVDGGVSKSAFGPPVSSVDFSRLALC